MPTVLDMKVTREDLNPCTIKLDVVCSPDQVENGYRRAYKDYAKQIRVPGFRPGQAPRAMIAKMVPQEDLNNHAVEIIVGSALQKALTDEKIQPHDSPSVNVTKIEEDKECEFTAKVPLAPQVEIGDYKGIEASKPQFDLTDADVDAALAAIDKGAEPVDGSVRAGDFVIVHVKGEKEDEGTNIVGEVGKLDPALDAAVTGMRSEEVKVVDLTLPANVAGSGNAAIKGKARLLLKSSTSPALAEIGNALKIGTKGAFKALEKERQGEAKEALKNHLTRIRESIANEFVTETIQTKLLAASTVHVPDTMWEAVANQRLQELNNEANRGGKSLKDSSEERGMTLEEAIAFWQAEAKVQVQRAVIAREIFAKEKLRLSNEDLNQTLISMAMEYNVHPQALAEAMQKNKNFQELEIRAVFRKVLDFLLENATISEGSAGAAPAKKAKTAKKEVAEEAVETDKPKKTTKKKADA